MTGVAELKALCKELGLKQSGTKSEVQEKIARSLPRAKTNGKEEFSSGTHDDFEAMSDDDLRCSLIARGLNSVGTEKAAPGSLALTTAHMLRNSVKGVKALKDRDGYETISQALQAAADRDGGSLQDILGEVREKASAQSKYVEVRIKSIGMTPEVYTNGGAPSATAKVIPGLLPVIPLVKYPSSALPMPILAIVEIRAPKHARRFTA
jgi:hypothetical protein